MGGLGLQTQMLRSAKEAIVMNGAVSPEINVQSK